MSFSNRLGTGCQRKLLLTSFVFMCLIHRIYPGPLLHDTRLSGEGEFYAVRWTFRGGGRRHFRSPVTGSRKIRLAPFGVEGTVWTFRSVVDEDTILVPDTYSPPTLALLSPDVPESPQVIQRNNYFSTVPIEDFFLIFISDEGRRTSCRIKQENIHPCDSTSLFVNNSW